MNENFPLLHDPPRHYEREPWFYRIPIIGWVCGYARQLELERALVNQAADRGPVSESTWNRYAYSKEIRQKIESIVLNHAFPSGSTFHPLDPVEFMFVLRYGDLNEVAIIMDIEDQLGFEMGADLCAGLIEDQISFIDFIRMVQSSGMP
ncbi:MAG: hypothetical protein M3R13_06155 [Armatimonadota bacterium]|nr:hypothetical protein [Armatimonadota bacterium]